MSLRSHRTGVAFWTCQRHRKAREPAGVSCPHFTSSCPRGCFFSSIFESPLGDSRSPLTFSVTAETGLFDDHCTKSAISMLQFCLSDSRFIIYDIQKGPHDSPNSIPSLQREGHGDCSSPGGWLMGESELEARSPDSTGVYSPRTMQGL